MTRSHRLLGAALLCMLPALGLASRANADDAARLLLIVSQPDSKTERYFVNLVPFILQDMAGSPNEHAVVCSPQVPEVLAAIAAGKITAQDLIAPLSEDTARKVCRAIGATRLLRVSASRVKQGIAAHATLEVSGPTGWKTAFEYRPRDLRATRGIVLPAILAHAAAIVKGVGAESPASAPGLQAAVASAPAPPAGTVPGTPSASAGGSPGAAAPATAPAPADPNAGLATILERYRDAHEEANVIVSLRRAINARPRDASLRRQLAEAYRTRGMDAAARDEEVRAVALAPNDASLHRMLADSLLDSGDVDAALREYQTAVRLDGSSAVNQVALGDAYWNTGKTDEAVRCYAQAASADPASPLPHRRLARSAALRGDLGDCLSEMKIAFRLSTTRPNGLAGYTDEYVNLLQVLDTSLQDTLTSLQNDRKDFMSSARTREQVYKAAGDARTRAQGIADFLTELPGPEGFEGVQAQYGQAAALAAQSAGSFLTFLESQADAGDQQATLLRLESHRQLDGAEARVKRLTEKKPPEPATAALP